MASPSEDEDNDLAKALAMSLEGINIVTPYKDKEERVSPLPSSNTPIPKVEDSQNPSPAVPWFPNLNYIQVLLSMGISENAAKRALFHTGNQSPDLAAIWVFDHLQDADLHLEFTPPNNTLPDHAHIGHHGDGLNSLKMIFVVNTSLSMGLGKTGAQIGHATLALYKTLLLSHPQQRDLDEWEMGGAKKVVVKGMSAEHLKELQDKAGKLNIPNIIISDAGRTQVEAGSVTVLALFGRNEPVDQITGKLSLL